MLTKKMNLALRHAVQNATVDVCRANMTNQAMQRFQASRVCYCGAHGWPHVYRFSKYPCRIQMPRPVSRDTPISSVARDTSEDITERRNG